MLKLLAALAVPIWGFGMVGLCKLLQAVFEYETALTIWVLMWLPLALLGLLALRLSLPGVASPEAMAFHRSGAGHPDL